MLINHFSEIWIMFERSMRHIFRSMDTIITVCLTPIAIMLLFVYVFGGAINTGTSNYVDYLLPGILLMTIGSGIAYVSYRLFLDKQKGIFERFSTMPIAKSAVLWGHVLTSLVSNGLSIVVIIIVAFLMGFRPTATLGEWGLVILILGIFTLMLTWLAVIAGLLAKTPDGAGAFAYPILFLPFISSAFVPTETMPKMVRMFAEHQPVTPIVEALRNLLLNQPIDDHLWIALTWCTVLTLFTSLMAMRIFRHQV